MKFEKHQAFRVYEEFSGLISTDVVGNLLVEAEFPNHDSLYAYLLSFLDGVEVLEPPEVRQNLAKKLNEISQKYKSWQKLTSLLCYADDRKTEGVNKWNMNGEGLKKLYMV